MAISRLDDERKSQFEVCVVYTLILPHLSRQVILINYEFTKGVFEMTRMIRRYTKEFKEEAITLALKSASVVNTAKELGIPSATLHTWMKNIKAQGTPTSSTLADNQDVRTLLEENRRLHKELMITKEEREILKKAAAYFAQHQK